MSLIRAMDPEEKIDLSEPVAVFRNAAGHLVYSQEPTIPCDESGWEIWHPTPGNSGLYFGPCGSCLDIGA